MKKIQKNKLFFILLFFIAIVLISNKSYAKSYVVDSMDIQATINKDGSMEIDHTLTYDFNGDYNGIFIKIPNNLDDDKYDEFRTQKTLLNDSLYNGSGVEILEVSSGDTNFTKVSNAYNGDDKVYTETLESGLLTVKVFSPSNSEKKTFNIKYKINNVAVKHNDLGELYYNFIGGEWECRINKLNIDVHLPDNYDFSNLYIWAHGPYNGACKKVSEKQLNFYVEGIPAKNYVAARILFPLENIADSKKVSNLNAKELVFEEENAIIKNNEEKENFTLKVLAIAMILLVYWLVLIFIYEKDKIFILKNVDEEQIFEKYNPLLAGCIQGSREVVARDIIAVLLNLINKGVVKLEFFGNLEGEDNYNYMVTQVHENEGMMDEIESYVYNWFFGGSGEVAKTVNLAERLKTFPKEGIAVKKFEELNKMAMERLNNLGSNKKKVPKFLLFFNNLLFIGAIIVCISHIAFNGLDNFYVFDNLDNFVNFIIIILAIALNMLPLIMILLYIPLSLILSARKAVNKLVQKVTSQKIVSTAIAIILLWLVVIVFTGFLKVDNYLIVDQILLCIACLIIFTDNLMLKNEVTMIEDCSKLNSLKYKIQEYSLMNTRDIEEIMLWEKYLAYAVSFGISAKIMKRIKGLEIDDDLISLMNSGFYTVYIEDNYSHFYNHTGIEKRFLENYSKTTGKIFNSFGSSSGGSSRGGGGGFSGGGGSFRGGGRTRTEAEEPFKKYHYKS